MRFSYIYIWIIVMMLAVSCSQEQKEMPALHGIVKNHKNRTVYLYHNGRDPILIDSIQIAIDGTFTVAKQKVQETGFYYLDVPWQGKVPLFLVKNQYLDILFDANDLYKTIYSHTSEMHNRLWALDKNQKQFADDIDSVSKDIQSLIDQPLNKEALSQLVDTKYNLIQKYREKTEKILSGNQSPVVEFYALNQKWGNISLYDYTTDLQRIFDNAETLIKNPVLKPIFEDYDKKIVNIYAEQLAVQRYDIGDQFLQLGAITSAGEPFSIADQKANLSHIILWDSELPASIEKLEQIKMLLKNYSRNGVKTVMVSYSNNKNEWLKAINKYQLKCDHVIDTTAISSVDLKELGIYYLPQNFLIDSVGVILERDIWGVELEEFIKKKLESISQ